MTHVCIDDRNERCAPDHCVVIGCPYAVNPPRSPNRPPSPFEQFAKQAGKALLRSGGRALARGLGEAANSVADDADVFLEQGDKVLDALKARIANLRRPR